MTGEAANDNLSQRHRLRARAARILRPKEAQAVRDLHALRKRLRKEREERRGKALIDALDQGILDAHPRLTPKDLERRMRETW